MGVLEGLRWAWIDIMLRFCAMQIQALFEDTERKEEALYHIRST